MPQWSTLQTQSQPSEEAVAPEAEAYRRQPSEEAVAAEAEAYQQASVRQPSRITLLL